MRCRRSKWMASPIIWPTTSPASDEHPGDDMISALTRVHYPPLDRKLTDDEVYGIIYFMVLGGLETTQYALEEEAQLLCDQPALFAALKANPARSAPSPRRPCACARPPRACRPASPRATKSSRV